MFRHNLRILGLIESDAGMFQCIGSNSAGSIQAAARLEIVTPSKSHHIFEREKINTNFGSKLEKRNLMNFGICVK